MPLPFQYKDFNKVSKEAIEFVKLLLTYDQNNRPSAEEALQNEWFKKYLYKHPVSIEEVQDLYDNIVSQYSYLLDFQFYLQDRF